MSRRCGDENFRRRNIINNPDIGGAFDPSTVLTKTNTTPYTPTADYHPATKKYVDDTAGGGSGVSITTLTGTAGLPVKIYELAEGLYSITGWILTNNGSSTPTMLNFTEAQFTSVIVNTATRQIIIGNDKVFTVSPAGALISYVADLAAADVLTKTNTEEYTPTANYHPTTKKYVDDAIAAAGGSGGGGATHVTWQGIMPMSTVYVEYGMLYYAVLNGVLYIKGDPTLNLTTASEGDVALYTIPVTGDNGTNQIMAYKTTDGTIMPMRVEYDVLESATVLYIIKSATSTATAEAIRIPVTAIPLSVAQA